MTARQLVQLYEGGAIVSNHLLHEVLDGLNPDDADGDLRLLPPHLYGELSALLEGWRLGEMGSNHGPVTTPLENIRAARQWLGAKEKLGTGSV